MDCNFKFVFSESGERERERERHTHTHTHRERERERERNMYVQEIRIFSPGIGKVVGWLLNFSLMRIVQPNHLVVGLNFKVNGVP